MMLRPTVLLLAVFAVAAAPRPAAASVLAVPGDYPTIQAAVDAASDGDQIRVAPGEWCGATITKRVDLFGQGGATIVGCPAPHHDFVSVLRIGFFLPDDHASGTTIRHFVFDGRGVSDVNFEPLAFAVFARKAHSIVVEQNRILGTIQGITNTSGSGWNVSHNVIEGLTSLLGGGGVGIALQERATTGPRALDNSATFNIIRGVIPNALGFDMAGIVLFGQDGAVVKNNRVAFPDNPNAVGNGIGILVDDKCCGNDTFQTTINSVIAKNDGRDSELALVITLDSSGGTGNSVGTVLRGNFGVNLINDQNAVGVTNRSVKTLVEF